MSFFIIQKKLGAIVHSKNYSTPKLQLKLLIIYSYFLVANTIKAKNLKTFISVW